MRVQIRVCGLKVAVPRGAPSWVTTRTTLPGGIALAVLSMWISLE